MTPALLSQENYTKKFSKSQKAGFDLIFCVARNTEITARVGWWREAETSRNILQDAFKDCLCIHFVQVPFAPILFFGYLRV